MQEPRAAEEAERLEMDEASAAESGRVRVTDRRRVVLDEDNEAGVRVRSGAEGPSLKPKFVEELEARTRAAEQQAADVQARFEQVRADLRRETDELRQRLARTAEERAQRERAEFIASLLPVLDNLWRAIEAAEQQGTQEAALLDGLRGTASGFERALAAAGVEVVPALGAQFDPELHEAVDTAKVEPERDGIITAEHSRGYRMGGHLLRPARVQVGSSGQ